MMFHYFLQDQAGFLRAGYMPAADKNAARQTLERANIKELMDLSALPEEAIPKGARYMYPFAGRWRDKAVEGTVEGETLISALEHLSKVFNGTIDFIAERPPRTPEERSLFITQTAAFLTAFAPKTTPAAQPVENNAVATVLDRQFFETLEDIKQKTKELLRERQFADEVQEMYRVIFTQEQQKDLTLKDKYDTLSYVLRELSYIQDGLDPSPLKKEMGLQIENVVGLLKKVEKSMVRTAFHMDNVRIHQDLPDAQEEETPVQEVALSRYTSRKRLVSEVMVGIRALQSGGAGAAAVMSMQSGAAATTHQDNAAETLEHASEPLSLMLLRELPMLLQWFVGFSLVVIILGQTVNALANPVILFGYNLTEMLAPFAWQHVFLKTTLLATFALIGLRAYETLHSLWRWLSIVFLFLAATIVLLAL